MKITDLPTNWRDKYQQAQFRWAIFFVETDARQGGRRVALHEYPKRSVPYAEDMGRRANRFTVQGYLIGRITGKTKIPEPFGPLGQFGGINRPGEAVEEVSYLTLKNNLIECLEQDGPGMLRLPLPYRGQDIKVMVQGYSISENRERGGMCTVEMDFIEYGDPRYRETISTSGGITTAANNVDTAVTGDTTPDTPKEVAPIAAVHNDADVPNVVPPIESSEIPH